MKRIILFLIGIFIFLSADYIKKSEYDGRFADLVSIGDVNHNGYLEIYDPCFVGDNPDSQIIIVREYDHNFNPVNITHLPFYGIVWDIGDINSNGLIDIVVQAGDPGMGGNGYLRIYEQPNFNSFPTNLIAQIVLPGMKVYHFSRYADLDQDGKREIIMSPNVLFGGGGLRIYEWDNNGLNLVFNWDYPQNTGPKEIYDFNNNGRLELIMSAPGVGQNNSQCLIYIFECNGDNDYELIDSIIYPHPYAIMGSIVKLDFDGDKKKEFLASFSTHDLGYRFLVCKYLNNDYRILYDLGDSTGYIGSNSATAADFDQDGYDEFVATIQPWWLKIYEWQQTGPTWQILTNEEGLGLYNADFNQNGYPDIYAVIFRSGLGHLNHVEFWEYEPTGIREINLSPSEKIQLKVTPNVGKIFKITYPRIEEDIFIYNQMGQLVATVKPGLVNLSHLPTGIYFVKTNNSRPIKITIFK